MDEEQEKHGEDTSRMLKSPEEQRDHKKYEILGNSLTRSSLEQPKAPFWSRSCCLQGFTGIHPPLLHRETEQETQNW